MLLPLAALAAMAVFARFEVDPASAAESGYLAALATAVLLAAASLAATLPRPAPEIGLGAVLATAAVWALPAGPARGGAVVLVVGATLAVAGLRALRRVLPELPAEVAVPLALGFQVLLRGDLLFRLEMKPRTLVALVALPVAAGVAASVLARRHGGLAAAIAAGAVLVLAPGWNVAATLGMVALAAGDVLARRELGWPVRGVALAVLLAPIAWEPWTGAIAAVLGLALAFPKPAAVLALAVFAARLALPALAPGLVPDAPDGLAFPLLLVPALLLTDRSRFPFVVIAAVLAGVAPLVPDLSALAAPVAFMVLFLRPTGLRVQGAWTGLLLTAAVFTASYPWLRSESPVESLLGQPGSWISWLALASPFLFSGIGWAFERFSARRPEPRWGPGAAVAALAAVVLAAVLLSPGTPLIPGGTVVLDAAHPVWETTLPPQRVRAVAVESSLSNGAPLTNGTPVATVRFRGTDEDAPAWPLRAGEETGEWAALRPDVMPIARLRSPAPWISWVAGDFLGQRYRGVWKLAEPRRAARLRIERAAGLPADVVIALHGVEVRP
jgi:hypothetical protein